MKKAGVILLLLALLAVIAVLIVIEFTGNKPGRRGENPYAYRIGTLADVDSSWLKWEELRQLAIEKDSLSAITALGEGLFICGKDFYMELSPEGRQLEYFTFEGIPSAMAVDSQFVYLAFTRSVTRFTRDGKERVEWAAANGLSYITCLQSTGEFLFVADAGNREVMRYTINGELLNRFSGKNGEEGSYGFIIPSPYFDLDVNADGELWVANTGMHTIENYSFEGALRGFWTNPSFELNGFTGCCNPAHMTIMADGTFVTSEKGLVRIKTYKPSGELLSVVAEPAVFSNTHTAPDIAATASGLICALDYSINTVRIFRLKAD